MLHLLSEIMIIIIINAKYLARSVLYITLKIKTHDSESRGQEEAVICDERVSYLHVALL